MSELDEFKDYVTNNLSTNVDFCDDPEFNWDDWTTPIPPKDQWNEVARSIDTHLFESQTDSNGDPCW